jgi:hypothetical protein
MTRWPTPWSAGSGCYTNSRDVTSLGRFGRSTARSRPVADGERSTLNSPILKPGLGGHGQLHGRQRRPPHCPSGHHFGTDIARLGSPRRQFQAGIGRGLTLDGSSASLLRFDGHCSPHFDIRPYRFSVRHLPPISRGSAAGLPRGLPTMSPTHRRDHPFLPCPPQGGDVSDPNASGPPVGSASGSGTSRL